MSVSIRDDGFDIMLMCDSDDDIYKDGKEL